MTLPPSLAQYRVGELHALGSHVPYARQDRINPDADWRDTPVDILAVQSCGEDFLDKQARFLARCRHLFAAGLNLSHVLTLVRTWAAGAAVHLQRALPMPATWGPASDRQIQTFLAECLDMPSLTPAQRTQVHLKLKEGGVGLPSAATRSEAAFLGAWEGGLSHLAQCMGFNSLADLRTAWPAWARTVDSLEQRWAGRTGRSLNPQRWEALLELPATKRQKALADVAHSCAVKDLQNRLLTKPAALALEMCTGPEASACLTDDAKPLSTAHLRASLRFRLGDSEPVPMLQGCRHRGKCGRTCGLHFRHDGGHHARTCKLGGGVMRRHDAVRDALFRWLTELGVDVLREQVITQWIDPRTGSHAILDLVYIDSRLGRVCVDVSICDSVFDHHSTGSHQALTRRERKKHTDYPGQGLYAFVLDTRGRWGREARAWVNLAVRHLSGSDRPAAIRSCRQQVSSALLSCTADQMLSAASTVPAPPWNTASVAQVRPSADAVTPPPPPPPLAAGAHRRPRDDASGDATMSFLRADFAGATLNPADRMQQDGGIPMAEVRRVAARTEDLAISRRQPIVVHLPAADPSAMVAEDSAPEALLPHGAQVVGAQAEGGDAGPGIPMAEVRPVAAREEDGAMVAENQAREALLPHGAPQVVRAQAEGGDAGPSDSSGPMIEDGEDMVD